MFRYVPSNVEVLSIKQMVDYMSAQNRSIKKRILITGFSAGAAMTLVMLATYAEVFASGAVIAGTPYKSRTFSNQADNVPANAPLPVYHAMYRHLYNSETKRCVRLLKDDPFEKVTPKSWGDLVGSITRTRSPSRSTPDPKVTHRLYKAGEATVVESYKIKGLAHLIPVNPETSETPGGTAQSEDPYYSVNIPGFYSAYWISKFFGLISD